MPNQRIISLLPACTEIVCALGRPDQLVGRSHECDFPKSIQHLPVCTEPRFERNLTGRELDRQVKRLAQTAQSIYRLAADRLTELRPDFILTQEQCDVCAINLLEVERIVAASMAARPQILAFSTHRLTDLWDNIRRLAEALGAAAQGKDLLRQLKGRLVDVLEQTCQLKHKPSVACIEWIDPLMAAGNWLPELVELAGGLNCFGEPGKHSPWLNWEAVREQDPEIMIILPCGFDLPRTRAEMPALTARPDWGELRCVRHRRVYLADGNQYFNRPGPRLVESLEILAEILHPDRFNFGHVGKGWQRL